MHSVGPAGVRDQASGEGFAEITSGESRWQQGLVATCKDPTNEAERPKSPRPAPRLFDSNRSPTACQASGVKEIWLFCLRPAVKARRLIGISGPGALPQSDSHSIYSDSFVAQLPAGLRSPLFLISLPIKCLHESCVTHINRASECNEPRALDPRQAPFGA